MDKPTVFADFQNADPSGRVRLNCTGTISDLAQQQIVLREGLSLTLHDEELEADGTVCFSPEERLWVAAIDWQAVRRRSA
jgi:hypothetical protein